MTLETTNSIIIELPENSDLSEFENNLNSIFQANNALQSLIIDMTNVVYLQVSSMIYLIAITDNFLNRNIDVKFYLPESLSVRNIMRIWRFPSVMKEITGRGFASMVRLQDLKYFGESQISERHYDVFDNDEGLIELVKKDFFSIVSIPFSKEDRSNAIDRQHGKWSEEIIKSILKRHLDGYNNEKENIIPNRIIYECMTNAFRHSNAEKLVTGSYFDKNGHFFTISYWDNGYSIVDTLSPMIPKLKELQAIQSSDKETNNNSVHFSVEVKSEIIDETLNNFYHTGDKLKSDLSPAEIFLYSFAPNITRDIDGKIAFRGNPYIDKQFNKPGMGLTTLLNATIDLLNGSIAVRTGEYFINFKKPDQGTKRKYEKSLNYKHDTFYIAKIDKFNNIPVFKGNMITIRLPLKKQK